jgi:hypothetical protein
MMIWLLVLLSPAIRTLPTPSPPMEMFLSVGVLSVTEESDILLAVMRSLWMGYPHFSAYYTTGVLIVVT